MDNPAKGWAVCNPLGFPKANTVAATRRAAIVNWLVSEAGVLIWNSDADSHIEKLWGQYSPRFQLQVREVEVRPLPEAQPITPKYLAEQAMRRGKFKAMEQASDKNALAAQLYGIEVASMTHEEAMTAMGWLLTEVRKLREEVK